MKKMNNGQFKKLFFQYGVGLGLRIKGLDGFND